MIPEAGRRFGPYEIQAKLGGGGMGHVYSAWDARLQREVAIKLLHDEFAMPGMRDRFLREARAASALNHPNICTIFDIGEQDGEPYLVMELLQGETLRDRIHRSTIQIGQLINIAREVAEALAAAHSKGVVHRDIKPANIFLVEKQNGRVQAKVLDFGLAKMDGPRGARDRDRLSDLTTTGAAVGTLAYMSPEQARGEVLDLRSDLFSLGVVLYEAATRQIPFQGATSALVFVQLLNHPPPPIRDWNDAIPKDLEKIILKLMAKERMARYQTAGELEEALNRLTEKPSTGWLRKAVATVPLVRAQDPVARPGRPMRPRSHSDSQAEAARLAQVPGPRLTPSPARSATSSQIIRPTDRLPEDSGESGRPSGDAIPAIPSRGELLFFAANNRERYHPEPSELDIFGKASSDSEPALIYPTGVPLASSIETSSSASGPMVDSTTELPADKEESPDALPITAPRNAAQTIFESRRQLRRSRRARLAIAMLMLIASILSVIVFVNRGRFGPTLLSEHDLIVVTDIQNKTGIRALDGAIADGLQIDLAESPFLRVASADSAREVIRLLQVESGAALTPVQARFIAERLRTRAYLRGFVDGTAPPYTIRLNLVATQDNVAMFSVMEHAATLEEIPAAIDRVAEDIRTQAGEQAESIGVTHVSLERAATSNLNALHAYSMGEDARIAGMTTDAIGYYQAAADLQPNFVQAQLRLAILYRRQRAEVAAGEAATFARNSLTPVGERTRQFAEYEYEMSVTGDLPQATAVIRHLLTEHPHDAEALADLARVLRLQGRLGEALQTAQQAYEEEPTNLDAYLQAESCLIGLDRFDAALQLEEQAHRLGLRRTGSGLIAAYLAGSRGKLDEATANFEAHPPGQLSAWPYGLYLDNAGHLARSLILWRTSAAAVRVVPGLESASAYLLSQGALDRALIGECDTALGLARESSNSPQGMVALFNNGMTAALCNMPDAARYAMTELHRRLPAGTAVNGYMLANLKAALDLQAGDPATALSDLSAARQFDLTSLTPFLRGRAHVALHQTEIGIVDFQTVLSHRGITFIVGSNVYPVAQIGVARAFADTGDVSNSAEAYRRFLELWKDADPDQALLVEAHSHTR